MNPATEIYCFGNGITVTKNTIDNISNQLIQIIKSELPEEAQNIDVIESVLEKINRNIRSKKLQL